MIPVNIRSPYLSDLEVALGQRDDLVKALKSLTNEMAGIWNAFEYGLRNEISNTNYAVAREKIAEAERVLGHVGGQNND
jgi:hypothetical protein